MANAYRCDVDMLTANDDGRRTTPPRVLYIHTFEGNDLSAEAMARYQLSPAAAGSYTLVIDANGRTARENDDEFIPWAAAWTANRNGHHISLAGRAAFTRDQWLARAAQLDKLAEVIAAYGTQYGYPPVMRFAGDLQAGKWGVSTHAEASAAWHESDHTDPGDGFPIDVVLTKASAILDARNPAPTAPTPTAIEQVPPGTKYPSYLDGRELRFSEYLRFIDEKITRLFDHAFPDGAGALAVDIAAGAVGPSYPSYAAGDKSFTLDQFLRLIDYKVDHLIRKELQ